MTLFSINTTEGKTSVARLYHDFLTSLRIVPKTDPIIETSGAELAADGPCNLRRDVRRLLKYDDTSGFLFIDESYQMLLDHRGRQVLDIILKSMSDKSDRLVVCFAGYKKQMELFLAYSQGLASRIPHRFYFPNFTKAGLWEVFVKHVRENYTEMRFTGGEDGIYVRIAIQRLERMSNKPSFGNARAVQARVNQIVQRQLIRLSKQELVIDEENAQKGVTEHEQGHHDLATAAQERSRRRGQHPVMRTREGMGIRSTGSSVLATRGDPRSSGDSSSSTSFDESSDDEPVDPKMKERYCLLTPDDIIGPPPGNALNSEA